MKLQGDYVSVIGAPMLRVRSDGVIFGATGKPIQFTGPGQSTTMKIQGKIRRVKRKDILLCVEKGLSLSLMYQTKRANLRYRGVKLSALHRYIELSDNISLFCTGMLEKDSSRIIQHLFERIPNYQAHFAKDRIDPDELRDIICECCMTLAEKIVEGDLIVVAPDNYIIRMVKCEIAKKFKKSR